MKKIICTLAVVIGACQKPGGDDDTINPTKLYTPSELNAKSNGACDQAKAWEGQMVQVRGRIDQPVLTETQNGGKFWLRDEKGFIEVYVEGASAEDLQSLHHRVVKGRAVTVTGKAVAGERQTQFKCKKSLHVEISKADAVVF
ncbi:hypothetical protein BWI93_07295 [Siphonobacter sp. BAB-5385]|uniref:OB-fold nucleic acid binding domain-containing protein n=1 Tax=unclassified Siphonobacter TaxID=2635712 RepID=UPI000B9E62F8|nr:MULTISPECIES: OB-fold nucleic acid binding domain-containing protein [unclassified Siphonobacter]OZI08831.1 hypothetical protein BWI93_07295 [Siphonobacter sp. BAB-5385]PMD92560.1 hypothetical protein BWI97_20990 [Siphonobacter sp. BAB-5405]